MASPTWDLRARPRRAARFARKIASTPKGLVLTQVGRAPSLTLEAPTVSSPLKTLRLGALYSGLVSSALRLPHVWEGPRLGGVTRRYPWPEAKSAWALGSGGRKYPLGTSPGWPDPSVASLEDGSVSLRLRLSPVLSSPSGRACGLSEGSLFCGWCWGLAAPPLGANASSPFSGIVLTCARGST